MTDDNMKAAREAAQRMIRRNIFSGFGRARLAPVETTPPLEVGGIYAAPAPDPVDYAPMPQPRFRAGVRTGREGSGADLEFKPGTRVDQLDAHITDIYPDLVQGWQDAGAPTPVITAGRDGRHRRGSLHYQNQAIDIRGNNLTPEQRSTLRDGLSQTLGDDYDAIFETFPDAPQRDHMHIEYQPKTRR